MTHHMIKDAPVYIKIRFYINFKENQHFVFCGRDETIILKVIIGKFSLALADFI